MTKKTFFAAGGLLALTVVVAAFAYFLVGGRNHDENYVSVYFFNAALGSLESERRAVPADWELSGDMLLLQAAFSFVQREPNSAILSRPWPEMYVYRYFLDGDVLVVEFGESYLELESLTEALFRSALTLTMVELPFVDSVKIRLITDNGEHEHVFHESAQTIANAPSISPALQSDQTFTLFFIDESGEGLFYESYVAPAVNLHFRNQVILETLIANQNAYGALPSIPPETRVLSVNEYREAFAIYVNLSSEFFTRFGGGPSEARLMIASIANTLIENAAGSQLRRVYFFIESERREDFHGVAEFDLGFAFDETLVIGFTYEEEVPPEAVAPLNDEEDLPYFEDDLD